MEGFAFLMVIKMETLISTVKIKLSGVELFLLDPPLFVPQFLDLAV